jgi:mono/diheme cytochrome c family protein
MPDFTDPTGMRRASDRFLFDIIKKGSSQFGRSNAMPSWGMKLSDEEIQALVAYIRSLAPRASGGPQDRKEMP